MRAKACRKDYAAAMKWFRKAADQGYGDAQNNLGAYTTMAKGCRRTMCRPTSGTTLPLQNYQEPMTL